MKILVWKKSYILKQQQLKELPKLFKKTLKIWTSIFPYTKLLDLSFAKILFLPGSFFI